MKKILAALVSSLLIQAPAFADQCVVDRYQINGTQLAADDRLELTIDGNVAAVTLNARNSAPNRWPAILGRRVNAVINAGVASAGTQAKLDELGRYIPQNSATDNFLDIMQSGANVSLTLNSNDFSNALVAQTSEQSSAGEALIPAWQTSFITRALQNYVLLSNITDQDITVNIELFDQTGAVYNESVDGGVQINGINTDPNALLSETGVVLPAKQSLTFSLNTNGAATRFGHGTIKWSADTCLDKALTGVMFRYYFTNQAIGESQYALNGGKAF